MRKPPTREQLIEELARVKSRKSYYKTAAGFWRIAAICFAATSAILIAVVALGDDSSAIAASQRRTDAGTCGACDTAFQAAATTPAFVLSSVHMANGNHCSGTVIGDDKHNFALIVSASHCVAGNIGRSCWWHLPTGKPFRAELIAVDRSIDVSVFKVDRGDVIATTKLVTPSGWSADQCDVRACGYPCGRGPNLKTLTFSGKSTINRGMPRWDYTVHDGTFAGGDSGGGVFFDGLLSGVITHKNGSTLYAVPQPDLYRYVSKVAAEQLPGLPIAAQCPGGRCVPCPPPGGHDEQAPAPPPFTPAPNVPINPPPGRNRIRDADRDVAIDKLRAAVEAIEKRIDRLDVDVDVDAFVLRLETLAEENGVIVDRVDLLEQRIADCAAANSGAGTEQIAGAIRDLKIELAAVAAVANRPPAEAPPVDIDDILRRMPKIPVRVVDEQGAIVDSESYKLGEPITLFGRYRSRATN